MSGLINFFSFYSLPLLSACLIGTSYIPFPPWAVFFCYIPLWLFTLKQQKLHPILIGAWLCQFITTLIGFNWVAYSIKEMGVSSWPLAILGSLIFSSFANLNIPIALFFWFVSQKKLSKIKHPLVHSVFIPLLLPVYSALSMEYYPMIFDWHFGYTWLYAKWPAVQTAEIWGFQFLNTLTLFFNLLFLFVFQNFKKEFQIKGFLSFKGFFINFLIKLKNLSLPSTLQQFFKNKTKTHYIHQYQLLSLLKKRRDIFIPLSSWILLFTGLNFYGQYLKTRWPEPDQKTSVLIVQPNIENDKQGEEKWNDFILSKVLQETAKHLWTNPSEEKNMESTENTETKKKQKNQISDKKNPEESSKGQIKLSKTRTVIGKKPALPVDFILWPEGSYPYIINKTQAKKGTDPVQKWVSVLNTPLVISAEGESPQGHTNSVFVFDQYGRPVQAPYDKTLLMPFGEYTPFEKWFPFIRQLFFEDKSFKPGTGANKVIGLNGLNLGLQICYEGLFDWLTRNVVREGADILVNVTNDAWFGGWQEPWQHLYMTAARAIEVRRPLIRGTNSGFSSVISAKGDIASPWMLGKTLSWIEEVPYYSKENKKQSLFISWGYYINQFFLWISLILIHILPNAIFRPIKTQNTKNLTELNYEEGEVK